jgi:hypothetical protein
VSRLERCLDAVKLVLEASKKETTTMQAAATDAQPRIVGNGVSLSYRPAHCLSFLIFL